MKKILLFVATALFAISGTAQNAQLSKAASLTVPGNNTMLNEAAAPRAFKAQKVAKKGSQYAV